jgi:hypothetical protein
LNPDFYREVASAPAIMHDERPCGKHALSLVPDYLPFSSKAVLDECIIANFTHREVKRHMAV